MKEFTINSNEAGQRFDKYLKKLLPNATGGFIYKMLRKKNITLKGHKASGTEIIKTGDVVKLFLSDETFDKFSTDLTSLKEEYDSLSSLNLGGLQIIYEDEDILIANKPSNMLSQKAAEKDISANERLIGYLINTGKLSFDDYKTFHPSVCNRLDRNTTGLILMGKSLKGLQDLSQILKDRSIEKYYRTIVLGTITKEQHIEGYLTKDSNKNIVQITPNKISDESAAIATAYKPIYTNNDLTLLEVHLITGRSHQIRAHLASIGHPIIGDYKYGDSSINQTYKAKYKIKHQLLHAYNIKFPDGKVFTADLPDIYNKIMND